MKTDRCDVEELAFAVLEMDIESPYHQAHFEDALYCKLGVTFDQFHKVVEALIPFTVPAQSPLADEYHQGFADLSKQYFIVKIPVNQREST